MSPLDGVADWASSTAPGAATVEVVAASMCRDGRVRQAAVIALAGVPEPVAAAALAVRFADWVPEVRSAAVAAIAARSGYGDAAACVPVLLAIRDRQRGRQPAQECLAGLAAGDVGVLRALAAAGERAGRLWALQALAVRGLLTPGELTDQALRGQDPVIALWCARQLADPSGDLLVPAGPRLLRSLRAGVRAFAVGHVAESLLTRPVREKLLVDRSGAVRSAARWRWKRQWGDPAPVYRAALETADLPYQVAAALSGLNEEHDSCLPAAAVPFLTHPSAAVRCAAVRAIGACGTECDVSGLLIPLLHDTSGKVTATAVRELRGHVVPSQVIAALEGSGTGTSRRIALSLRQQQGVWERIEADLTAVNGQDRDLADAALTDLLAWLQYGAATSYARPTPSQAAAITALLRTERLTSTQRREIAFVIGIR
jgi:hypothetical protein